ncbi:hypothetical protein [Neisseria sicca]|uniref:hypothetical protein n=1 Tax=Neisseria sicca TaxID=490 RepID=UPI001649FC17|nr:hypothetical protein [Neisseria sicca]
MYFISLMSEIVEKKLSFSRQSLVNMRQGRLKTLIPVFRRPCRNCLNQLADSTL